MMRGLELRVRQNSRPWWFAVSVCLVTVVNDGFSGKPSPLLHQLILLPLTAVFLVAVSSLLLPSDSVVDADDREILWLVPWIYLSGCFEALSLVMIVYEEHHFARFGYRFSPVSAAILGLMFVGSVIYAALRKTTFSLLCATIVAYAAGLLYAVVAFPLNYLRSDMLPVIMWADERLLIHLNPYGTMHVGSRVYDFPYLPGMLVAFLPAIALHLDIRTITLTCCLAVAGLLYVSARPEQKTQAVVLIAAFLLCPFLQYRHDLYLAPHWLALTASIVLLRYGRNHWSALLFGVSMALYQLSWVLFPFLVLYAYRRRGWREGLKTTVVSLAGMLLILAPFLRSATERIASNTVGQWSHMPHALADPMNLSYWVTYLVRPDQLKWVQLAVMTGIFGYCVFRGRCQDLTDTLRWMSVALMLFIMLNVLVDGYFYLTLLLMLMMYTFAACGLWPALQPGFQGGVGKGASAHRASHLESEERPRPQAALRWG